MHVAILGTGACGLSMAAHLIQNDHTIALWNRNSDDFRYLKKAGAFRCDGIIKGEFRINLITENIEEACNGADVIMVTTPAHVHRAIAKQIGRLQYRNTPILLNPGRTFGAIEVHYILSKNGWRNIPPIAELQTIIYTARKICFNSVKLLAFKKSVKISALDIENSKLIMEFIPLCIRKHLTIANNFIETSLGNVGMILHVAPTLLNCGWIEHPKTNFKYYYEGITTSMVNLLRLLDIERINVAGALGVKLESVLEWMKNAYGVDGKDLLACVRKNDMYNQIDAPRNLFHRYILEDVSCGLVPLEALGRKLGVDVRKTTLLIDLASTMLGIDFRISGRNLSRVGLSHEKIFRLLRAHPNVKTDEIYP